jgi:hypothetical protein
MQEKSDNFDYFKSFLNQILLIEKKFKMSQVTAMDRQWTAYLSIDSLHGPVTLVLGNCNIVTQWLVAGTESVPSVLEF